MLTVAPTINVGALTAKAMAAAGIARSMPGVAAAAPADASGPEARGAKPNIRAYWARSQRTEIPLAQPHHQA